MEDRSRGHRGLPATGRAHPPRLRRLPGPRRRAGRTDEAIGPPQLRQVLQASLVVREPLLELLERARIVDPADRMRANRFGHPQILLDSSNYPIHLCYAGVVAARRAHEGVLGV